MHEKYDPQQVEAAAQKNTESKRCFLVDYQMPTDPHVIECAQRYRAGALGNLGLVKSFYYGGLFPDLLAQYGLSQSTGGNHES